MTLLSDRTALPGRQGRDAAERRTTLTAIAAEAGVSLPTVSKVVNGRPDVSPATRARVERLLDKHHYSRGSLRRHYRSGLVDLVFNGLDSPWAVEILRGVEEWGASHETGVAVSAVRHGNARPASWTSTLASHDTDGVILVTSELTGEQLRQLRSAGIPLVVVDPVNPPPADLPSVGATNWAGGLAATEHLLTLGHRRIGAIAGPGDYLCSRARIDGYRSALERAGIPFDPELVRHGDFHHEGGFVRGGELLALASPPTAIFAGSDQQAFGVYEAARQRGLRVPQDLSVVGFDDLPVARWVSPPLTTVRQPLAEMGRAAAHMLGDLIEGVPLRSSRVELSTELTVRESTAAPRGGPTVTRQPDESRQPDETCVTGTWNDPSCPVAGRVADLLAQMTLEEKIAQLGSVWMGASGDGDGVAPMQNQFTAELPPLDELIKHGLGQLTRVYGTRPVEPAAGARALAGLQARIIAASRFGIPAVAHEECLTGFAAWSATIFPTPLAWGASFDPALVGEMAAAIGHSMQAAGVQQGLAPVLDVTRDPRWGRTEETIGEDPYLVGTIGTAYVTGLQSAGVDATLKHFAGYSASRASRNMAPVSMGGREFADVILPPFEMAIRLGGARSVMPSYTDLDGIPASADPGLLSGILRDRLGFAGLVVSDYYAVSFLELRHAIAGSPAAAAALALAAGVDVELPSVRCYGAPLRVAAASGELDLEILDRAVARVLRQKCELGMLDPGWSPFPARPGEGPDGDALAPDLDLDPPASRALARRLAEESVVLLANPAGLLPLDATVKVAVVGPLADDPLAFFGCYAMPRHLGTHPETGVGVTTVLAAVAAELPDVRYARGCDVRAMDRSGFAAAAEVASAADVVVAVIGDESGLFGRGTSGEGCDATELRLPGVQEDLLRALTDTGKPVVAVLVTGRPYAIGEVMGRLGGVVQAFFPGEEGGPAIAGVLSGRVVPSGKLPVEMPGSAAGQPSPYLRSPLAARHSASSVDPAPLFAFGHGLSYTTFGYGDLALSAAEVPTDGALEVSCTVRNTGPRAGAEVVQLYLSDPVAQVVRPVHWLAGFARVELEPGQARRVTFRLHADRTAFCGLAGEHIVEPGEIRVAVGGGSDSLPLCGSFTLTGPVRSTGPRRVLDTPVTVAAV